MFSRVSLLYTLQTTRSFNAPDPLSANHVQLIWAPSEQSETLPSHCSILLHIPAPGSPGVSSNLLTSQTRAEIASPPFPDQAFPWLFRPSRGSSRTEAAAAMSGGLATVIDKLPPTRSFLCRSEDLAE
jgi:hypothetical protein